MAMRALLGVLAALLAWNGGSMLFTPAEWFQSLPSVPHTGAFNPHFVRDVGCAYVAAAGGLALAAWRPAWLVPGGLTALAFLGLHAGVHVWEAVEGHPAAAAAGAIDHIGVYGPPLIVLGVLAACAHTASFRSSHRTARPEV